MTHSNTQSNIIAGNTLDKSQQEPGKKTSRILITNEQLLSKYNLELKPPDEVLRNEGYQYYNKMLKTDAHVYSIITTRKMGASSFPFTLIPRNSSSQALQQKNFMDFLLKEIPIEDHFFDILDCIPKGFAIHEIITRHTNKNDDFNNKVIIDSLIFQNQKYFSFKAKSKIGYEIFYKGEHSGEKKPIPSVAILHSIFDSHSPYGAPLLEKLYWYYWFKKETGFKFWAIFLEKFGGPTAILSYPDGDTSTALQDQALAILEDLQNETGVVIPDSFSLEFQGARQGSVTFDKMIQICNSEMSKAVLGATQTVEEGKRGSYALSRTHTDVRAEYKNHDTRILRKTIQTQIINRFINLNFSKPLPPRIQFIIHPEGDIVHTSPETIHNKDFLPPTGPRGGKINIQDGKDKKDVNPDHKVNISDNNINKLAEIIIKKFRERG